MVVVAKVARDFQTKAREEHGQRENEHVIFCSKHISTASLAPIIVPLSPSLPIFFTFSHQHSPLPSGFFLTELYIFIFFFWLFFFYCLLGLHSRSLNGT